MTLDEAKEYAKTMSYEDAVYNALQGRAIPYKKATKIKLDELIENQKSVIEELEKLKRRINQLSLGKWYVGRLDGKTEEVASMEEINFVFDKRLSELKGENK